MAATDEHDEWDSAEAESAPKSLRVLLYSDHRQTREAVLSAVGSRIGADLPPVEWLEVATAPMVVSAADAGGLDLLVLDGEAGKYGGIGLCRQLKDEIFRCPPILVLIGRPQDAWLASSSHADAVVAHPLDPIVVQEAVAGLLRRAAVAR